MSPGLAAFSIQTHQTQSQHDGNTTDQGFSISTMVDKMREHLRRGSLSPQIFSHNRCLPTGLGGTPGPPHDTRQVVNTRSTPSQKPARTQSSKICLSSLPITHKKWINLCDDNVAWMFYINRQRGVQSHSLCTKAMRLWNWCIQHHIDISASDLPGCRNTTADTLSRWFSQEHNGNWTLVSYNRYSINGVPIYQLSSLTVVKFLVGIRAKESFEDGFESG